jgi:hypothetical protein
VPIWNSLTTLFKVLLVSRPLSSKAAVEIEMTALKPNGRVLGYAYSVSNGSIFLLRGQLVFLCDSAFFLLSQCHHLCGSISINLVTLFLSKTSGLLLNLLLDHLGFLVDEPVLSVSRPFFVRVCLPVEHSASVCDCSES